MHIKDLLEQHIKIADKTVPDWMIGCFKRRSISFANGQTDTKTHVFWLQGRNLTIDLRLPIEAEMLTKSWDKCNEKELYQLANYEGWSADSTWQKEQLSWSGGTSFQVHNRWPEPAILSRVGDCMIEASPYESYIEDWRITSRKAGALLSLELITEENLTTGEIRHQGGALIINSEWAGLVLGRASELSLIEQNNILREHVKNSATDKDFLAQVFNFETSVAKGNLITGFDVQFSTQPERIGESLFSLEGFEFDDEKNEIIQLFNEGDQTIKRRFLIDTIEPSFAYSGKTAWHNSAEQWFDNEQETIGRYLEKLT
ncbi:hypothetical protein [Colwellia echini]|uniref:Uncharacterized protein n=1 Tax=Colwellia echini TaxID=1982103 RepID=A0ABY3MZI7_9GAMM|nr:hypothetical protein [Colwellia echini]TYK66623.1 hypothetical protein CWS31_004625 [Colwellia echini]